jgi:hypothetical protein
MRLKTNLTVIDDALDKVNSLTGYEFDWIEEFKDHHGFEGHDVGIIAQDVEAVLPEVVTTKFNGFKGVKYDKMVPLLIEAIKELSRQVDELKNQK